MSKARTIPSPETGRPVDGYIVIAPLSKESKHAIYAIQDNLQARFPDNKFWFPREEQLHITFAHIITPNAEYPEDPKVIWGRIGAQARAALKSCIPDSLNIDVVFDSIETFPNSIILKGHDDGTYDKLRQDFVNNFELPDSSRRPPNIIHTTIARFYDEMDLGQVQEYVNSLDLSFIETTTELQVIHETGLYVHKHIVLERIPGKG